MIDVNRVHDVLEGETGGRGCGKTYAMLISALGFADFEGPEIEIIASNYREAEHLFQQLIYIAHTEMHFEKVEKIKRFQVIINYRLYKIGVPQPHVPEGYQGNPTYVDAHFRGDMRFINCGMGDDELKPHWKYNRKYYY